MKVHYETTAPFERSSSSSIHALNTVVLWPYQGARLKVFGLIEGDGISVTGVTASSRVSKQPEEPFVEIEVDGNGVVYLELAGGKPGPAGIRIRATYDEPGVQRSNYPQDYR